MSHAHDTNHEYTYKNTISNYTKTYNGVTIGPQGVTYSLDNIELNQFVPVDLERYVDGVLSITDLARPVSVSEQEVYEHMQEHARTGTSDHLVETEESIGIVGVAITFTSLSVADSVAYPGYLQISSAGLHGLTTGLTHADKHIYISWSGGTLESELYIIKSVDSNYIITLDRTSTNFAGFGTPVVTKVGTKVPIVTVLVRGGALGYNGEIYVEALFNHTSSPNNKVIDIGFDGDNYAEYTTPNNTSSTYYVTQVRNRTSTSQICQGILNPGSSRANPLEIGTADTTIDFLVSINVTLAVANEVITAEHYFIKIEA